MSLKYEPASEQMAKLLDYDPKTGERIVSFSKVWSLPPEPVVLNYNEYENTTYQTVNTKHQTPNNQHQTLNTKH